MVGCILQQMNLNQWMQLSFGEGFKNVSDALCSFQMTRARWEPQQHNDRRYRHRPEEGRREGRGQGGREGQGEHGGHKNGHDGWTEEWRRASEGDKIDRFKGI